MNNALTMESLSLAFPSEQSLDGVLSFLASRSKRSVRELSSPTSEIFNGIAVIMDELILNAIQKRTKDEFNASFEENFPKYVAMTIALSQFSHAVVPPEVVERLTRESICEMESDFREKALPVFGSVVRDQAVFTIWTLRKINDLLTQILATKLDDSKKQEDREYSRQFNHYALCGYFSLDCLNMALRIDRPIYPEVMAELTDGMRAIVNAYAFARRGAALRIPSLEQPSVATIVDDEDEYLLGASMQDMSLLDDE